jgi:hypothetical protein
MRRILLPLFYIAIGWTTILAQSIAPTMTAGKDMSIPRMGHQAVTLTNNNVLLIGGHGTSFVSLGSSDIYNPSTDAFTLQTMNAIHDCGAVTKLSNSTYLIAGGATDLGCAPGVASAEIYDPSANTFTSTGAMNYQRCLNTAATLLSGEVLIAGGWYSSSSATYGETYSTSTGTFTATGAINVLRANTVLLPTTDGGALMIGGSPIYGGTALESVEYYNAATRTFTLLRERLCSSSDSAWFPFVADQYGRLMDAQRMKNGNYLCMATKAFGDSTIYSLFTVNPITKVIALLTTKTALPSANFWNFAAPIVDTSKSVAYLPATKPNTDPIIMTVFAVNLEDSTIVSPSTYDTLPSSYYLSGTRFVLMNDGRIHMSGGHSQTGYNTNFSPNQLTYIISPNYTKRVTGITSQTTTRTATFTLNQNYPNPFNPSTVIRYQLPVTSNVNIKVYDIMGRDVATLVNEMKNAGNYEVTFNASLLASGVYFYRMSAGSFVSVKKLVLMK